jgi:hypothetical protein
MPAETNENTYEITQSETSNSRVFISSVGTGRAGWPVVLEELMISVEEQLGDKKVDHMTRDDRYLPSSENGIVSVSSQYCQ